MTDKGKFVDALHQVGSMIDDAEANGFAGAVLHLLPELWALWKRHRGDVQAMRRALREQDDLLARGRADVEAALAHKHDPDTLVSILGDDPK